MMHDAGQSTVSTLRIHDLLARSRANGPGARGVIWLQGCRRGCPGCFNPATHDHRGGRDMPVSELLAWVASLPLETEGITVSGGEPLEQAEALCDLLRQVRQTTSLGVLLFTGLPPGEWDGDGDMQRCIELSDAVIAGPFEAANAEPNGLLASSNQTIVLVTSRYSAADISTAPSGEIIVTLEGEIIASGMDPPHGIAGEPSA
jgi:anaerobic ribonucleoside-triphosphate reductase activating protein